MYRFFQKARTRDHAPKNHNRHRPTKRGNYSLILLLPVRSSILLNVLKFNSIYQESLSPLLRLERWNGNSHCSVGDCCERFGVYVMGAPKQKWTSEEEAALKAGIQKYGIGKWSTILKDPEFSTFLRSRSNVDLKDKWRNLNCMANGLGSRHRARVPSKNNQLTPKHDEDTKASGMVVEKDTNVLSASTLATSSETSQDAGSKKKISRLDDVILEAITKLKEPRGSSRPAITQYIEDNYTAPPDLERTLAANLKILTENERLIKVKHQYRIAPKFISFTGGKEHKLLLENGGGKEVFQAERPVVLLSKAKIDAELEKMKSMSAEEAVAAAARAVAEAEAAIAEAEAAAREAEEAEAEAEAAQCFADAAQKALNYQAIRV